MRKLHNLSDSEDAVYVIVGGKDGYVGRDGKLPEGETRFGAGGPPEPPDEPETSRRAALADRYHAIPQVFIGTSAIKDSLSAFAVERICFGKPPGKSSRSTWPSGT